MGEIDRERERERESRVRGSSTTKFGSLGSHLRHQQHSSRPAQGKSNKTNPFLHFRPALRQREREREREGGGGGGGCFRHLWKRSTQEGEEQASFIIRSNLKIYSKICHDDKELFDSGWSFVHNQRLTRLRSPLSQWGLFQVEPLKIWYSSCYPARRLAF